MDTTLQYFITFLKQKFESFEEFKEFYNEVQKQLGKTIMSIWSDRCGGYLSQEFDKKLTLGIVE